MDKVRSADEPATAYNRPGRSDGGDRPSCRIGCEVEDLAAVPATTGDSPAVYGHSSGGMLALEAAARGVSMARLAVDEPPFLAAAARVVAERIVGSSTATIAGEGHRGVSGALAPVLAAFILGRP